MGRFGSMIGESQLNDWGKPAQSWGRASSMIGKSQLNDVGEQPQLITLSNSPKGKLLLPKGKLQPPQRGISPSPLGERHLASRRGRPQPTGRASSIMAESQRSRDEEIARRSCNIRVSNSPLLRNSLRVHFHSVLNLKSALRRPRFPVVPLAC